jgi:hypothetical protein
VETEEVVVAQEAAVDKAVEVEDQAVVEEVAEAVEPVAVVAEEDKVENKTKI